MVDCKKLNKQPCLNNPQECTWEVGKGCRNKASVLQTVTAPPVSQSATVQVSKTTTAAPVTQTANNDMIYSPATNRYVKKSGKVGQSLLKASLASATKKSPSPPKNTHVAAAKTNSPSSPKKSPSPPKKSPSRPKKSSPSPPKKSPSPSPAAAKNSSSPDRLQMLQKQMQDAIHVINVWLGDVSDEAGELKSGIANQILDFVLTGKHDPFVKSRQAAQDLENKYK